MMQSGMPIKIFRAIMNDAIGNAQIFKSIGNDAIGIVQKIFRAIKNNAIGNACHKIFEQS